MTEGEVNGKSMRHQNQNVLIVTQLTLIAMVQLEVDVECWTFWLPLVQHLVPSLLPALHVPPPL